jgi:hypothetical protein
LEPAARLNEDTGHVELGIEDDGAFVALATMPEPQFRSTIDNVKASQTEEQTTA